MTIKPPSYASAHPNRDVDCQVALEAALHGVLDEAVRAGWSKQDVVTAAMELANAWYFGRRANGETKAEIGATRAVKERH